MLKAQIKFHHGIRINKYLAFLFDFIQYWMQFLTGYCCGLPLSVKNTLGKHEKDLSFFELI
jgi:hypothetical protein